MGIMRELNRTRRLIVASSIFVIIIIIGLITFRKPDLEYRLSTESMVEELIGRNDEMTPARALEIMNTDDAAYLFVDLRSPYEYDRGTLKNAVNIPVSDILDEPNIEFFRQLEKESVTLVFFGNDQRSANGPWMMMKQLGFSNIRVLLGGYDYFINAESGNPGLVDTKGFEAEEPNLDFSDFMKKNYGAGIQQTEEKPISVTPVRKKKKSTAEGGC